MESQTGIVGGNGKRSANTCRKFRFLIADVGIGFGLDIGVDVGVAVCVGVGVGCGVMGLVLQIGIADRYCRGKRKRDLQI